MRFPSKKIIPRYSVLVFLMGFLGVVIIAKAAYIMFAERSYWAAVHSRYVTKEKTIYPNRGDILSADGQLLASTLPEYKLYMDFMVVEKNPKRKAKEQAKRDSLLNLKMDSLSKGMHRIFPDINPSDFCDLLRQGRNKKSKNWLLYPKRVPYVQYRQVLALPFFNMGPNRSGFHVEEFRQRVKPFGSLAYRTVGDMFGGKDQARCGLELFYDSVLRGKNGLMHRQRVMNKYLNFVDQPAQDGYDLQTTLDVSMQDICEESLNDKLTELGANSGVCILMEVNTGDIKAMTSLTRCDDGKYREIRNSAVSDLREPGSVFKPVSFMVAMDDGYIDMNSGVNVNGGIMDMYGRKMRDHNWAKGGYGYLTVPEILEFSSNCGVSFLIDKYYKNQPQRFVDGIYRTGIAENFHVPIPGYTAAHIRHPKPDLSNWSHTALPWMSIGYESQVPPISTLAFYNGVANNGKMMQPRLVKAITQNGEVVQEFPPVVVRESMCKPQTIQNLQTILEWVVSRGLGKRAGSPYFHVSGKTGTAQVWTKAGFASEYFVSFAGYFPSEKPKYSCIVCIQKSGIASGGGMCGPVFKRVAETVMAQNVHLDYATARDTMHTLMPIVLNGNLTAASNVLNALNIKASSIDENSSLVWGTCQNNSDNIGLQPMSENKKVVPNVTGMGLRDAVFLLEKLGLRVHATGMGRVVSQSIAPGNALVKGVTISLQLDKNSAEADAALKVVEPSDSDSIKTKPVDEEVVGQSAQKPAESTAQTTPAKPAKQTAPEKKNSDTQSKKKTDIIADDKKKPATDKKKKTTTKDVKKSAATPQKKTSKSSKTTKKK